MPVFYDDIFQCIPQEWRANPEIMRWATNVSRLALRTGGGAEDLIDVNITVIAEIQSDILDIQGDILALELRATTLEGRATALESRASALETRATTLESRATTLESRATALETRATNLETRADDYESSVDSEFLYSSIETLNRELKQLTEDIETHGD